MSKVLLQRKRNGRRYRVLEAQDIESLVLPDELSQYFVAILLAPGWEANESAWKIASRRFLDRGLCYCCAWADGKAEGLHDVVDRIVLDEQRYEGKSVIMTTWHDKETLEEAVWYFVHCAEPTESYEETCRDWLCCAVGDEQTAVQALKAMQALFSRS